MLVNFSFFACSLHRTVARFTATTLQSVTSRPYSISTLGAVPAALIAATLIVATGTARAAFELNILHINDHHSHLESSRLDLKLNGKKTRVKAGGFPALATAIKSLSEGRENVLKLHAGDALSGDLYYTLFKGEANAALMNSICFDAFALAIMSLMMVMQDSPSSSIICAKVSATRPPWQPTWC